MSEDQTSSETPVEGPVGAQAEARAAVVAEDLYAGRRPNPALAHLHERARTVFDQMARTVDESLTMLDILMPTWVNDAVRPRPALVEFHMMMNMATTCTASGALFPCGTLTPVGHVDRSLHEPHDLHLWTIAPEGPIEWQELPADFVRAQVPAHLPVPVQREFVTAWLELSTQWAELLLEVADIQDPSWEDMTIRADGPPACFGLLHLYSARRALDDVASNLRLEVAPSAAFPARARVTELRYGPQPWDNDLDEPRRSRRSTARDGAKAGAHSEPGVLADVPGTDDAAPEVTTQQPVSTAAALIVAERKRRGWTQRELAERIGTNAAYLSGIESGRSPISKSMAARIELAFADEREQHLPFSSLLGPSAAHREASDPGPAHRHSWGAITGEGALPLLVRCSGCGMSHLLEAARLNGFDEAEHEHTWTPYFGADGNLQPPELVLCECGASARLASG